MTIDIFQEPVYNISILWFTCTAIGFYLSKGESVSFGIIYLFSYAVNKNNHWEKKIAVLNLFHYVKVKKNHYLGEKDPKSLHSPQYPFI